MGALDACGLDREAVARELSRLVGEAVSVHTVNNWCATEKSDRRVPLEYAAALVAITGDASILRAALEVAGFRVLGPEDVPVYELGRIAVEETRRRRAKRAVMERIGL